MLPIGGLPEPEEAESDNVYGNGLGMCSWCSDHAYLNVEHDRWHEAARRAVCREELMI